MKKILLGLVAAFAFTTIGATVARAEGEDAAKTEKAPKKKAGGKKKADKEEKKEGEAK